MAKYVDKEDIFNQGEWMYDPEAEWEGDAPRYAVKMSTIQLMQPADVVEREKIDKALDKTYKIYNDVLYTNGYYEPNDVLDIIDQITKLFKEL